MVKMMQMSFNNSPREVNFISIEKLFHKLSLNRQRTPNLTTSNRYFCSNNQRHINI